MKRRSQGEQQIIKAAKRLFLSRGYHNVSTQDIVKEAQVAKGTLYHHFPSKDDLAVAILEELLKEDMEAFQFEVNSVEEFLTVLKEMMWKFSIDAKENRSLTALVMELVASIEDDRSKERLHTLIDGMLDEYATFVKNYGRFDDMLVDIVAFMIDGLIFHVIMRPGHFTNERLSSVIEKMIEMIRSEVKKNE